MSTIIVAGALANKHRNGGGAWERMSWVVGLARLGCDVCFVEQITPQKCVDATGAVTAFADSVNLAWFRSVTQFFGIADRAALVCADGPECAGMSWARLLEIAGSADLLVNLSGHLTLAPLFDRIGRKAYIDVDPGFTQYWHADPDTPFAVGGHDFYFTVGENIGLPGCTIPMGGILWRPIRQPVVLDQWPVTPLDRRDRFTTVASWRGPFGPVQVNGRTFGLKVHEFRKFMEFPRLVPATCEVALDIHASDRKDLCALEQHGWRVADPNEVAGDPHDFRQYVQESAAEFSVAQGIYVETNSGWFSERTVRYLASGRPALVQDTGFSRNLPVGEGLLSFRSISEAAQGARQIIDDYERHQQAARSLAETYFDSDRVLRPFLEVTLGPID